MSEITPAHTRTRALVENFITRMFAARPAVLFAGPVLQGLTELAVSCYELGKHDAHHGSTTRAPDPRAAGQYLIVNNEEDNDDDP